MYEENDWDQVTNVDVLLRPIQMVEIIHAVKMKLGKSVLK